MSQPDGLVDPLYLFVCHLEWRRTSNAAAYQELVAALNAIDPEIRGVAEVLLHEHPSLSQPLDTNARAG